MACILMVPWLGLEQASELKHTLSIYVLGKAIKTWGRDALIGFLLNRTQPRRARSIGSASWPKRRRVGHSGAQQLGRLGVTMPSPACQVCELAEVADAGRYRVSLSPHRLTAPAAVPLESEALEAPGTPVKELEGRRKRQSAARTTCKRYRRDRRPVRRSR